MAKGRISDVKKVADWVEIWMKKNQEEYEDITKYIQSFSKKIETCLLSFGYDAWLNILDACNIKTFTLEEVRGLKSRFEKFLCNVEDELVKRLTN